METEETMETEAAVVMWGRSLQLHNFQYMEMLGDGDGKAHGKVNGLHPYRPEVSIKKIECVNHVTKRMGTAPVSYTHLTLPTKIGV